MGKRGSKVAPIDIPALPLGCVNILASWAEHLDPRFPKLVRHPHGEDELALAENSRARSEGSLKMPLSHLLQSLLG